MAFSLSISHLDKYTICRTGKKKFRTILCLHIETFIYPSLEKHFFFKTFFKNYSETMMMGERTRSSLRTLKIHLTGVYVH